MTVACLLAAGWILNGNASAQEKSKDYGINIGIGTSTSLKWSCTLTIEHPFAERWSVSASAGFNIRSNEHADGHNETAMHNYEFKGPSIIESSQHEHMAGFSLSYWPKGEGKGASVILGAEHLSTDGFDAICGLSYRIPIWKGISASINYRLRCISTVLYGSKKAGAAGIDIFYRF